MLQVFLKGQLDSGRIDNFYRKLNVKPFNSKPESHEIRLDDYDVDIVSSEGQRTSTRESFYYGAIVLSEDVTIIREYFKGLFEGFRESYGDVPDMVHLFSHRFNRGKLPVGRFLECRVNLYKNL